MRQWVYSSISVCSPNSKCLASPIPKIWLWSQKWVTWPWPRPFGSCRPWTSWANTWHGLYRIQTLKTCSSRSTDIKEDAKRKKQVIYLGDFGYLRSSAMSSFDRAHTTSYTPFNCVCLVHFRDIASAVLCCMIRCLPLLIGRTPPCKSQILLRYLIRSWSAIGFEPASNMLRTR